MEKTGFYTSKQWDEDVELYYFNARWYDPETGRFITEDPIRDGTGWYSYVGNNPMGFVDPTGLMDVNTNGIPDDYESDISMLNRDESRTYQDETTKQYIQIMQDQNKNSTGNVGTEKATEEPVKEVKENTDEEVETSKEIGGGEDPPTGDEAEVKSEEETQEDGEVVEEEATETKTEEEQINGTIGGVGPIQSIPEDETTWTAIYTEYSIMAGCSTYENSDGLYGYGIATVFFSNDIGESFTGIFSFRLDQAQAAILTAGASLALGAVSQKFAVNTPYNEIANSYTGLFYSSGIMSPIKGPLGVSGQVINGSTLWHGAEGAIGLGGGGGIGTVSFDYEVLDIMSTHEAMGLIGLLFYGYSSGVQPEGLYP